MLTPTNLVLLWGVFTSVPVFGGNQSRTATVRVLTDGQIHRVHRQTHIADAERFDSLLRGAVCYSYGAH